LRRAQVGLRSKTCSAIVCFYAGVQRRNNFTIGFCRSYSPFAASVHERDGCVFPRRNPLITQPQALGRQNHTSLSCLGRNVGRPSPPSTITAHHGNDLAACGNWSCPEGEVPLAHPSRSDTPSTWKPIIMRSPSKSVTYPAPKSPQVAGQKPTGLLATGFV
jgi:hypothetical protein